MTGGEIDVNYFPYICLISEVKIGNDAKLRIEGFRTQFLKLCNLFPKSTAYDYIYRLAIFHDQMTYKPKKTYSRMCSIFCVITHHGTTTFSGWK